MRIFTERAFQEELAKRRKEREKEEWMSRRFRDIDERIESLTASIEELRFRIECNEAKGDTE